MFIVTICAIVGILFGLGSQSLTIDNKDRTHDSSLASAHDMYGPDLFDTWIDLWGTEYEFVRNKSYIQLDALDEGQYPILVVDGHEASSGSAIAYTDWFELDVPDELDPSDSFYVSSIAIAAADIDNGVFVKNVIGIDFVGVNTVNGVVTTHTFLPWGTSGSEESNGDRAEAFSIEWNDMVEMLEEVGGGGQCEDLCASLFFSSAAASFTEMRILILGCGIIPDPFSGICAQGLTAATIILILDDYILYGQCVEECSCPPGFPATPTPSWPEPYTVPSNNLVDVEAALGEIFDSQYDIIAGDHVRLESTGYNEWNAYAYVAGSEATTSAELDVSDSIEFEQVPAIDGISVASVVGRLQSMSGEYSVGGLLTTYSWEDEGSHQVAYFIPLIVAAYDDLASLETFAGDDVFDSFNPWAPCDISDCWDPTASAFRKLAAYGIAYALVCSFGVPGPVQAACWVFYGQWITAKMMNSLGGLTACAARLCDPVECTLTPTPTSTRTPTPILTNTPISTKTVTPTPVLTPTAVAGVCGQVTAFQRCSCWAIPGACWPGCELGFDEACDTVKCNCTQGDIASCRWLCTRGLAWACAFVTATPNVPTPTPCP
ncbi:MAG: hypothetical protein IPG72_10315 [Ardenticatenales bacterium]|nr:hypothetical protein [Ardenticatenales bacterium]